jgi:hypothetical protein
LSTGPAPAGPAAPRPWIFPAVIFLGSFLLFLLEPLYAKLLLPRFGGSASVWALCLVFYQSALLLGYSYADLSVQKLTPKAQAFLHISLLAGSLFLLPIAPGDHWRARPGTDPTWLILGLLSLKIGLPFALLSATSPLLQAWFSRGGAKTSAYPLFALSNGASLAALLAFPFLLEPALSSHVLVFLWSGTYALFVAACSWAAWLARKGAAPPPAAAPGKSGEPPVKASHRAAWLALSALGSMLLLSITNQLTQNIAPVPLLCVVPLALYLATFILVFSSRKFYPGSWIIWPMPLLLFALVFFFYNPNRLSGLSANLWLFLSGLFACCLFCHGELARLRPPKTHLTGYYLMIALGGALGSVFVGLGAPRFFPNLLEFPLSLILAMGAVLWALWGRGWFARAYGVFFLLYFSYAVYVQLSLRERTTVVEMRNFYAPLRVQLREEPGAGKYLTLVNGTIEHGKQFEDPGRALEPTTYYSRGSGIGLVLGRPSQSPRRVGVVGLGAGTLAAYGRPGDVFRFYEINPQVLQVAGEYFSFLSKSPAKVERVPGDARLSMEAEEPQNYDVLAVDAFSGDAIPVHLLTREAFALYFRHLKAGGVLALHTSNSYLDLAPLVVKLAVEAGYPALCVQNRDQDDRLISSAEWILITRDEALLQDPALLASAVPVALPPSLRAWTDDFNSLFSVLKRGP